MKEICLKRDWINFENKLEIEDKNIFKTINFWICSHISIRFMMYNVNYPINYNKHATIYKRLKKYET